MDYQKLNQCASQIRREEANISNQIDDLRDSLSLLEKKLRIRKYHLEILMTIHNEIFTASIEGKKQSAVFLDLGPALRECTSWSTIVQAHESLQKLLTDVGVKDPIVESLIHFRIRRPSEMIPHTETDTVISFSF